MFHRLVYDHNLCIDSTVSVWFQGYANLPLSAQPCCKTRRAVYRKVPHLTFNRSHAKGLWDCIAMLEPILPINAFCTNRKSFWEKTIIGKPLSCWILVFINNGWRVFIVQSSKSHTHVPLLLCFIYTVWHLSRIKWCYHRGVLNGTDVMLKYSVVYS